MKSHKSKRIAHAVIVWPKDLEELDRYLREKFLDVYYGAECSDGTTMEPGSLQELLMYENPGFRRIVRISVGAFRLKGKEPGADDQASKYGASRLSNRVEIVFKRDSLSWFLFGNGSINLNFEDVSDQVAVEDEITKRIVAMRPWYSPLTQIPFTVLIPGGIMLVAALVILVLAIGRLLGMWHIVTGPGDSGESAIMSYGLLFLVVIVGLLLDQLRSYFLPSIFFCIGRQEQDLARRKNIGIRVFEIVVIVIGLGVAVNIVSSYLWNRISTR